ncbi:MAG: alpha-amylase family glycosyl hydrolase, partial [Micrococcales bacterium]|nr:alpha-amylase family glycosyl hydrolase [Micrococcales bacterium]
FTPEGTFAAAAHHLPHLADLGVSIVWLTPVHEAGGKGRAPCPVRDYDSVDPALGTLGDLRSFVAAAHDVGLHVIVDWVATHTACDCRLVAEHPDWYTRDWKGGLAPAWRQWDDVADLDYSVPAVRDYMVDAMVRWTRELGLDGFRCDIAGLVPTDFWERARAELDAVRPVFLLAEWESRELHERAFDATYSWSWGEAVRTIADGDANANALRSYYAWNSKAYRADAMRMLFVTNHDQNVWDGTDFERFGGALEVAVVLSVLSEGIPLVYNGHEDGNERRLAFFDSDPVGWRDHPMGELYRRLIALKKANSALWNGAWGARMVEVRTTKPSRVLAFTRQSPNDDAVLMVANLSPQRRSVCLTDGPYTGTWTDFATGDRVKLTKNAGIDLGKWGYRALVRGSGA